MTVRPFTVTSERGGQSETVDASVDELLAFLALVPLTVMAADGDPITVTVREDASGWVEAPPPTGSWDPRTAGVQHGTYEPPEDAR